MTDEPTGPAAVAQAMAELVDRKLAPVLERLDAIEARLDEQAADEG